MLNQNIIHNRNRNLFCVLNPCDVDVYSLRKFHLEDWSFEQKWVGILLPLLLAFDNPMFAYTLFTSNPLPGAIDAIGQVCILKENRIHTSFKRIPP